MINVFVSRPTKVDPEFEPGLNVFLTRLSDLGLEPRTLGVSDYPTTSPMDEVIALMDRCRGAVILGLPQLTITRGFIRARPVTDVQLATEWNHIEAALAYAKALPLLVIHHSGVSRGVFDRGTTNSYIYEQDLKSPDWPTSAGIGGAVREWRDKCLVRNEEERAGLERRERESQQANSARLVAQFEKSAGWSGRGTRCSIVIVNRGPATAYDVDLQFPEGGDPIPVNERKRKLPLRELAFEASYELISAPVMGNAPPYHAELSWRDGLGHQRAVFPLG